MPAVTFLLAAGVSFATGTSYGTMGLLMPLCVAIDHQLLSGNGATIDGAHHPQMLATIGAVLAGAIFGDHCSPISDTTVLSSAATACDHLAHVRTQIPYALTVAAVSLFLGYIPAGYGISPYWLLPAGAAVLFAVVRWRGQIPRGSSQNE